MKTYKHQYIFVLRSSLEGTYVASWHEITEDEKETKSVLFGMTMSSTMNMGSGILKVLANEAWTAELMDIHISNMNTTELKQFIKECKV